MNNKKSRWPIFLILGLFWLSFLILLLISMNGTNDRFIYPLDDTYIHINIAENFSQHGVWGTSQNSFSSLSSSLLWSSLLSLAFYIFGSNAIIPLVLTVILASLLLILVFKQFNARSIPPIFSFFGLFAILLFTPLLPLVFTGLEHVLHALLALLFINTSAKTLSTDSNSSYKVLLILGMLMILVRYEAGFMISAVAFLFLIRKKWIHSLLLVTAGAAPISLFGFFSLHKGWYFLPNSVLLKGNVPDFSSFRNFANWLAEPWKLAFSHPHMMLLLLISLFILFILLFKERTLWKPSTIMVFLFSISIITHIQFAKIGWFYRYEAYLLILGIFTIIMAVQEIIIKNKQPGKIRHIEIAIISLIIIGALTTRGFIAHTEISQASKNIFEQQFQMGLFLKNHYQKKEIAANDIGAINYLADIKCLDLWGLNSMAVAQAKRKKVFDTEFIRKITHANHIKIAVLYEHWYDDFGGLPKEWSKIAEWSISDNVVCGDDTVSFYAVNPEEKEALAANLKQFSFVLPKDVRQRLLIRKQ